MMEQMSDAIFAQMRDGLSRATGNAIDPGLQSLLDRYLERYRVLSNRHNEESMPALIEAMARAYARSFSLDDLRQIRGFASTPAGTRYFRQATAILSDPDVAEANRAYEHRFGHVFLVRARGRSGAELLGLLRGRLDNDDETERGVVRRELAEITSLRLRELW